MPSSPPAPDGAGRLSVAEALGWCGRRPHREALRTDTIGGPLIRPATPEDAAAVVDLVVQAEMFSADEAGLVEGMLADYLGGNADGGHACVIDEEEDGTLGVAYYQPKPAADRVWGLTMIAVRPDRQGRGRGSAMLRGVEEDLRARPAAAAGRDLRVAAVRAHARVLRQVRLRTGGARPRLLGGGRRPGRVPQGPGRALEHGHEAQSGTTKGRIHPTA